MRGPDGWGQNRTRQPSWAGGTDVCQLRVSVQAPFRLFISAGLKSLYLQEILETGNNYENIPRPHGSSIILKMEKDSLL